VFDVLDRPVSLRAAPDAAAITRPHGKLVFSDVSFAYQHGEQVIHRLNLHVPPGSSLGIVGPSGAGKSTIASLAARLYDPIDGTIAIDGVDLRKLTLSSLRSTVTVVTQDTFLFQDSVFNNLRYGNPTAWRTEVERAAKLAQIHDVICALPEGYDTVVGPRGYRLSGGERQRLAIARALLADPRIIIFDEATSALDTAVERRLQDSLAAFVKGRTTVTIAHRLSTVRDADVIVVIDRGQIVETGTHDYLMARRGLYAWLWAVQSRENERASVLRKHPLDIGSRVGLGEREHQKNARF
jgi:ATP-binding cassette subfamily B protein